MWPSANLAIDLASASLLDIAPDSPEWLAEFERRGLPAGAAVWQSGSGIGHVHYLFRKPEGCPLYRLCRPDEYDILTNGYSIVPPSSNRIGPYVWLHALPSNLADLPDAPAWAVEMLRLTTKEQRPAGNGAVDRTAFDTPPVQLGPRAMEWWQGSRTQTKASGEVDRSETLFTIALCLASRGASEEVVASAIADRDAALGYHKYSGRTDGGDLEYQRIAAKATSVAGNRAEPTTHSALPTLKRGEPSNNLRLKAGGSAILDEPLETPALWGEGEAILAAQGEPTMIYGPTGIGKGTLSQQLVLASIGIRPSELLGLPVAPRRRWLYLALDRPAQIKRSFRRMVEAGQRSMLDERLVLHDGPLDFDIGQEPERLVALAREAGADAVVIDSLKDAAAGLEKSEVGQLVNRAHQLLATNGIDVVINHHPRKAQVGNPKPKAIDDVFGSRFIPDGCGSVILLWGAPGDALVELSHLKQPRDSVGPWTLLHDHEAGVTTLEEKVDAFTIISASKGVSAEGIARRLFKTDSPNRAQVENARRKAQALVKKGLAVEKPGISGGKDGGSPSLYFRADTVHAPFTVTSISDSKSVHAPVHAENVYADEAPITKGVSTDSEGDHESDHGVHEPTVHDSASLYREGGRDVSKAKVVRI